MEDRELEELLQDIESDRAERKENFADKDRIGQAICAFANDLPNHGRAGVVFVGARDDGTCANLDITDRLLQTLGAMRSDGNILPLPTMAVQKRNLGGCDVAVVIVQPSFAPPVRFRGLVWIRVGPRRAVATAEEERRLAEKRRAGDLPFDLRPFPSADLGDLDMDLFRRTYLPAEQSHEILEQNSRSLEHQLASVRFATPPPESVPTSVGLLVVGTSPRYFIPGDYVQFLRFAGTELTDPIVDQKEIDGPLPDLLRMLEEVFKAHISVESDFTSRETEIRRADYPIVALQQLVRNAIMHRDYELSNAPVRIYWFGDRIEIHNPGGPYGQVNRGNFGQPGITDYRNPNLSAAMKSLGYVQRFGIGIESARKELAKNGNPPPGFQVEDTNICAILRRSQ
ncbi:MAG: ATP-binding protein [Pseudomonadota bacterium]